MEELEVLDRPKQKELARLLTPSGAHQLSVVAIEGENLKEFIDRAIPEDLRGYVLAFNHGAKVAEPENFIVRADDSILLAVVPQGGGGGGKGILGALLTVAVMVAAVVLAAPTGGASLWLAGATGMSAATAGLVIGAGVSMIGMMAISALIPPPSMNQPSPVSMGQQTSQTYSLAGQSNGAKKYGPVTKIYGRHKYFPVLAANPVIANIATESRISALYDFGLGEVEVTDLKIGDTDASTFGPEFAWHKNSLVKDTKFVTKRVGYDQFSYLLKKDAELIIRTKTNTVAFDVDVTFQQGLTFIPGHDPNLNWTVPLNFEMYYRKVGDPAWTGVDASKAVTGLNAWGTGSVTLQGASRQPFVAVVSIDGLTPGEYEFRVKRTTADETRANVLDKAYLSMIKSYQNGGIVTINKNHTMVEMKILASDKIQGTVQNFSGIATSVLRTTTDGVTFKREATRNPAWIALDILTGEASKKPLKDELIDWPSFIKLAKYAEDNKYYCDVVVDYLTTVQDLLQSVLGVARASMVFTSGGKYGVLIDQEKTVPRQLITPTNSWGFSGNRVFIDPPHAFLVTFVNGWDPKVGSGTAPSVTWQRDERIVYADGYDETNATKFETLQTFGITDSDQAWKYGRYMLAQGIHRSETFTVTMDVENLVVQRGDLVHVAHDVPKIGGMACRVVDVTGSTVTVDNLLSMYPNGYSVRLDDGTVRTGKVVSSQAANAFIIDDTTGINVDDIIVLGETNRVVEKYIVQAINAGSNLTAELTLVKYVPEVYQADQGKIPEWNPEFSQDMINSTTLAIDNLVAPQKIVYVARQPFAEYNLKWDVIGNGYGYADIYAKLHNGVEHLVATVKDKESRYLIDLNKNPDLVDRDITFTVRPFTAGGVPGREASVTDQTKADKTPPDTPIGFAVNIQSETVMCMWAHPPEEDVIEYQLRYSPDTSAGANWDNAQHLATVPYTSTQVSAGARTGTYFLRSYDSSGNKSAVVSQVTTIAQLPNVEQVTDIDDRLTGWNGTKYNLVTRTVRKNRSMAEWAILANEPALDAVGAGIGDLISDGAWGSVIPEGFYTFKDIVDLQDIFEVRVYSMIEAHGEDQLGNTVSPDYWDTWLEYRVSSAKNFIDSWTSLSAQPDLLGSSTSDWSEWRRISVGDITGRLIQFRIQVRSFDPNVKVNITDGSVIIDAVDRVWSKEDVLVEASGHRVDFIPPFMFDDIAVAVSVDGSDKLLIPNISNKSRTGCTITLLDSTGVHTAGKVDVIARGQGRERTKSI